MNRGARDKVVAALFCLRLKVGDGLEEVGVQLAGIQSLIGLDVVRELNDLQLQSGLGRQVVIDEGED